VCSFVSSDLALADAPVGTKPELREVPLLSPVVVTGMRASLANAQEIKREKIEIVDSVSAEDIGKLPDQNVTDALSRIAGVQILRDRGEGAGVAIRGLIQMETLINGREMFTAGTTRTVDFADLPSVMFAGIDVYKTSSARQLEGGIGGTIDLRTPRPFDFKTSKVSGSVRAVHDDLVKKTEPQYAALASNRWQTENWGEVGLLLGAAWQKRAWREDQLSMGNPQARTDIIPGQTVIAANGISSSTSKGQRERSAFDLALQWRPSDALELYAEGNYARFKTRQDTYQINIGSSATFVPGSPVLVPGSNNLQSITWTNAPISILGFARDTVDENRQVAIGGVWKEKDTTLKADLSRTKSYSNLFFAGTILSGTAASFTQGTGGGTPSGSVSGTNLQDPANFNYTGLMYRVRPYEGDLTALRFDGEQIVGGSFIDALSAGVRLARRNGGNGKGLIFGDVTLATPIGAGSMPGYTIGWPGGNYFFGDGFVVGNPDAGRNPGDLYAGFGVATPLPDAGNPLGVWHIREDTQAAYAMADFHGPDVMFDGNAGLRVVHTGGQVTGNQTAPGGVGTVPIQVDSSYTDFLPSLNLRHAVNEQTQLRAAWSKTITRQNLDQLSPSLTLNRNGVNPALNQGSAGNPDLKPTRANNLDIALENYFAPTGSVSLTGFYKRVDGFVVNSSAPERHNGEIYQISRPQNINPADIKGAELGYQQFYDVLPGYGLRATYTYVDSSTPNAALRGSIPLPNLSRNSYNLIGMYELNELSVRLAYNWRSTFLSGVNNYAGVGSLPVYTKAYGWLDASLSYRLGKGITLVLEGNNLLRTVRRSYLVEESRPYSVIVNDRQFAVGLLFSL
jgi:TonB-dependent receptor